MEYEREWRVHLHLDRRGLLYSTVLQICIPWNKAQSDSVHGTARYCVKHGCGFPAVRELLIRFGFDASVRSAGRGEAQNMMLFSDASHVVFCCGSLALCPWFQYKLRQHKNCKDAHRLCECDHHQCEATHSSGSLSGASSLRTMPQEERHRLRRLQASRES